MRLHPRLTTPAIAAAALALAAPGASRAGVTPAPLFANHAVLQHGKPVPVWGAAAAGETVTVTYLGQRKTAVASAAGRWRLALDPMEPGRSGTLVIKGENTLAFSDVVTGEVWLASGQSNMALQLKATANAKEEAAAADCPGIREFKVALAVSPIPRDSLSGRWTPCTPRSAGDYGAAAYYFARELHAALKMPVGIINSSKGGTPIEAWMSAVALKESGLSGAVAARWREQARDHPAKLAAYNAGALPEWEKKAAAARAAGKTPPPRPSPPPGGPGDHRIPTGLHGGMIHALIPCSLRGALWYQGEANAARPAEYPALFEALVSDWRRAWGQGDFPFFYVQLPNYEIPAREDRGRNLWPALREAQARSLARLPGAGMAVAIDIGDPGDVHPANKRDIGNRLARLALAKVYGRDIAWSGPAARSATRENDALRIAFDHAGGVMKTRDGRPPGGFEIAGADGRFHPAAARIEDGTVLVRSPAVPAPESVRYAWKNNPSDANLAGADNLPAPPFTLRVIFDF
ncbi:MAG: sialate O-acetylesterase [Opitutaceae bacterium]|jgi:sialate O-acetylesterase|nr:sialate O-acetylesterase [Opitutaceae bacterium]